MKRIKLVGLFAGGLIVGAVATGWYSWQVFGRQMASKEIELAFKAAEQAEWLAQLRLNDPQVAIKQIEKSMDSEVFTLAQWEGAKPLDQKTRERRDKFLAPVKVYHESYPADSEEAAVVSSLLANVPGRDLKKHCKSGVCRLDDLRHGIVGANTNSPPK